MQMKVFHQIINFNQWVIICQSSSGTGKTEVIQLLTHYFLSKSIMFLISAASNNTVNINAFKFLKHLISQSKGIQGIYCIIPNVFKSIYSISTFNVCDDDDNTDGNIDADVCDIVVPSIALQSLSFNITNYQPDAADLKRLYSYFKTQLLHISMDKFSLSKHILSCLNNFLTESESELMNLIKYELLCHLLEIKKCVKTWEPVKTAGTIYELNNSVKNFNNVWLKI